MGLLKFRFTIYLIFSLLSVSVLGADVTVRANPLDFPGVANTKVGIYIKDLADGKVLYDVNSDLPLIPASITKALTSASVLTLRDSAFRFNTDVIIVGDFTGSNLKGNVVIRTVGDPTIESSQFKNTSGFADSIADALLALGINKVYGTVIVDQTAVPYDVEPAGWDDEDIVWPYGTNHHSANYKDNKFVLKFPSHISEPNVPNLTFSHTPAKRSLTISRERGTSQIRSKGTVKPKGESVTVSMPDPAAVMKNDVINAIRQRGIQIENKEYTVYNDKEKLIYSYESPVLLEILQSLMFRSDNMMAEAMLRLVSPGNSRSHAVNTEIDMWELRDIDSQGVVLEDGSGLSRRDRLTTSFLADVFEWMASHIKAGQYASLFPKAGKDGTLKNFLKDTPLQGKIALKTGSMKKIQSYAGFLLDDNGLPTHIIVFMINDFSCGRQAVVSAVENLLLANFAPDYKPQPAKPVRKTTKKTTRRKSSKK